MPDNLSEETFGFVDRLDLAIRETVGEDSELMKTFRSLLHDHGGGLEYIPRETRVSKKERDVWIKENFRGDFDDIKSRIRERFDINMSIRQLRRIV